jgi:hypothetical protein
MRRNAVISPTPADASPSGITAPSAPAAADKAPIKL